MQNFNELSLSAPVLRAITDLGYETPSQIQAEALPVLLGEPTDFIGLAATGTGKTAAFAIPLLERIDKTKSGVQAIILCPTRELALQVAGQIDLLGKHLGVRALPIYGGTGYGEQIAELRRGAKIVVGTPGRVVDHMEKGTLILANAHTVILDEADEMISMGFKESLEVVLDATPKGQCNIWLFSATMSREVRRVADTYLTKPKQVQVNRGEMLPQSVEQIFYACRESNKPDVLCKLIDGAVDFYGLIFCQTKSLVTGLTEFLVDKGYRVDCLHGDKGQADRERAMNAFRERRVNVLICTDVASRGLDVKDVTHVINYSIPRELENYVHRIGRTARSGKTGFAFSLVTPSHRHLIGKIERHTNSVMSEGQVPSRKDIGQKKVSKFLGDFLAQKDNIEPALELVDENWMEVVKAMDKEEILGRFLALSMKQLFEESPAAPAFAMQAQSKEPSDRDGRGRRGNDSWQSRPPRGFNIATKPPFAAGKRFGKDVRSDMPKGAAAPWAKPKASGGIVVAPRQPKVQA